MKRILINEALRQLISEDLNYKEALASLPSHLVNDIQGNNTSLSNCDVFDGHIGRMNLNKLIVKRFNDVKEYFSDDVSNVTADRAFDKLSKAIYACQKIEKNVKPQLEKLCFDILSDLFKFPQDEFDLEFYLVDEIDPSRSFDVFPEPSNVKDYSDTKSMHSLDDEIQKRRIIDALCVGGAMRITQKAMEEYTKELFDINEELPHLYSKVMKLNEFYLFLSKVENTEEEHNQAGYAEVTLQSEDNVASIKVEAIVFPVLLNECIKGLLELFASFGLPDDEEFAGEITKAADALYYEPWDMRIGPALFDSVFKNVPEFDTVNIPYILPELVKLDSNEFLSLVNECVVGTEKGAQEVENIANKALHDKDYDSFEDDMVNKGDEFGEKVLVTDEEMLDENGVYPDTFNMDEFKSITSFRGRVDYCKQRLKYLGRGSARIVFLVDNNTVLKLAWNRKGIAQNEAEARVKNDYVLSGYDFMPEVYDVDDDYQWIEMQLARRATQKDFKRITGYDFKTFCYWIQYCWNRCVAYNHQRRSIPKEYEDQFFTDEWDENYEYSIFQELEDYISNYQVEGIGDLQRLTSWGVVADKNGGEKLVLIDNGLDNDVLNNFYRKR